MIFRDNEFLNLVYTIENKVEELKKKTQELESKINVINANIKDKIDHIHQGISITDDYVRGNSKKIRLIIENLGLRVVKDQYDKYELIPKKE